MRHAKLVGAGVFLVAIAAPSHAASQQFVTDDAALVEPGACQLEAWHGRRASWVLPACQPLPRLEITGGFGFVETGAAERETRYVLQAKLLAREVEPGGAGYGVVLGLGLDPLGQIVARRLDTVYAYVPLSISFRDDRLLLHANLGWVHTRPRAGAEAEDDGPARAHEGTWAARGDVRLLDRLTAIGELFAQGRDRPEYPIGLRTTIVPDRLLTDVSYGGHTRPGERGIGWTAGLAWTPPALR